MKVKYPFTPSGLKLSLALIIVLAVVSSPIVTLVNPTLEAAAPSSAADGSALAPSTIGQDGSDFTTQAALSSLTARPTNNIVNTNSFYDVVFLTATAGAIKTIQVTFPVGTTIPSGAFFNEAEKCVPGGGCTELTGTASKSGQTITYTITNAVNVPVGTKIRLEFANINNPLQVSASYKVTVTTRDSANAIIDGPSQSTAYTIKQIGTNAIADNSITSSKPAESFMKKVVLRDNAAGNAAGWNPDGVTTVFTIFEPDIAGFGTMISIVVFELEVNHFCDVVSFFQASDFVIRCSSAPANNVDLHYVVENLPPHFSP